MRKVFNMITSTAASLVRMGLGSQVLKNSSSFKKPKTLLTLYVKESCPFSRKVREGLSMLDLDVNIRPCPIEGTRFRPELKREGGKEQLPFLIDENKNVKMYESKEILKYLFNEYGPGEKEIPYLMLDGFIPTGSSRLATLARSLPWHGLFQYKGNSLLSSLTLIPKKLFAEPHESHPEHPPINKPIHLYSFESCPYCRMVREALDSLEIPYFLHNLAKGSPKREEFLKTTGRLQFPYLVDENTQKRMFESSDIVDYLYSNYCPKEKSS